MDHSNAIVEAINRLMLKPLGFTRRNGLFNRRRGEFVDVVDVVANKAGDAVTLEVGVLHDGIYEAMWEAPPPRFANEAACLVHARIGALLEEAGGDVWWPLADPASPDRAVKAVEGPVLRFLQGHHDLKAIGTELARAIAKDRDPRAMLHLAILRHLRGEAEGARALFSDLGRTAPEDWTQRAAAVAARLGIGAKAAAS
jgi:hypothetical protein